MDREFLPKSFITLAVAAFIISIVVAFRFAESAASAQTGETAGALVVLDQDGKPKLRCPLKHTDVKAEISGFLSRVVVTQEFENPFKEKIEAVYAFPLPHNAAVDDMTMIVGDRTVRGKILPREEAQAVYEAARSNGQVASLLDQERPNIFTQSVANILPGEQVKITISYVETLKYEDGSYEFVFPMVVAPRYIPGATAETASPTNGFAPNTDQVPDGSRITPQPVAQGQRAGHDVSLDITLDAGLAIDSVGSETHDVEIDRPSLSRAHVRLKDLATIPNKDFILRYDVSGNAIQDALLTHRGSKGGFFTMILQPPERITPEDLTPKELVFVLDTSGSMSGFPIEKAKETMKMALDNLYPADTFNLITFAGDTNILFPHPVPATPANMRKAQAFLNSSSGYGGTEMMTAIKAALAASDAQDHVRIVCFMTDGEVGNDMEIISEVQKHPNARVFAFGIGASVNRFLLDKISQYGRGEVEYVGLNDDGSAAARRFYQRVRSPLLIDISIDWNGLPVTDIYPQRIPDLFSAKPVILTGRFTAPARGVVKLKGRIGGNDFVRNIVIDFPETEARHDVLASLWARQRVDDLMGQDYSGIQQATTKPDLKQTITQLGLEYRLMTHFTSFVAVEEMVVTDGGQPRRIDVPIEVPEGMNRAAVFGDAGNYVAVNGLTNLSATAPAQIMILNRSTASKAKPARRGRPGYGGGGGGGRGAASSPMPPNSPPMVADIAVFEPGKDKPLLSRLQPSLLEIVERLKTKNSTPSEGEKQFVVNGKAEVQIWLVEKSDDVLAKLKELGFEVVVDPKTSKLVIGRLPIEKLEALSTLNFVRYVAPQFAKP
ncbi:MAG: VIT and VWA domain-containing protein [Pyrinomonadaceae bacterium]